MRDDWNNRCAVCGFGKCEAHHLIPRQHEATRYDLRNGIALCARHHKFDTDISPHLNAAGWLHWLAREQPRVAGWYECMMLCGSHKKFNGTKNADYYRSVLRALRQYVEPEVFERVCGVRFSRYLIEGEADG